MMPCWLYNMYVNGRWWLCEGVLAAAVRLAPRSLHRRALERKLGEWYDPTLKYTDEDWRDSMEKKGRM